MISRSKQTGKRENTLVTLVKTSICATFCIASQLTNFPSDLRLSPGGAYVSARQYD
jgi:hypothetical protein